MDQRNSMINRLGERFGRIMKNIHLVVNKLLTNSKETKTMTINWFYDVIKSNQEYHKAHPQLHQAKISSLGM